MFKRITWMGTGMIVGASGAFWAKRKVEQAIEQYLPEQVADRAAASARGLGQTFKAAAHEGRAAMRATEAELRSRVDSRTFTGGTVPAGDDAQRPGAVRSDEIASDRVAGHRPRDFGRRSRHLDHR